MLINEYASCGKLNELLSQICSTVSLNQPDYLKGQIRLF